MTERGEIIRLTGGQRTPTDQAAALNGHRPVREVADGRTLSAPELEAADLVVFDEVAARADPLLARWIKDLTEAPLLLIRSRDEDIPPDLREFDGCAAADRPGDAAAHAKLLLSFREAWLRAKSLGLTTEDLRDEFRKYGLAPGLIGPRGLLPPGRVSLRDLVDVDAVQGQQMAICRLMGTAHGTFLMSFEPEGLPDEDGEPSVAMGPLSPYCAYLSGREETCLRSEYRAAREAMFAGTPIESPCAGGILLYSVPVSLTFRDLRWPLYAPTVAVGDIPGDEEIEVVAERYGANPDILGQMGEESKYWVLNQDKADEIKATISNLAETISREVSHEYGTAYQLFHRILTEREIILSEKLLAETNEKLRLKNEEIYEVTHAITHDLKKPLVTLKSCIGVLKMGGLGELSEPQTEAVDACSEATGYMQELVQDILEAARLDAGRKELEFADVDFPALVERIHKRLRFQLEEEGVEFVVEELPETVRCDEGAIEKVFMNLIGNAANYIGDGEKRITVRGGSDGDRTTLSVEDTGMGIPEESLPHIFEKFKRGGNVTGIRGTGLGLAIVDGIVRAHGGEVQIDTEVGRGTKVTIKLPGQEAGDPPAEHLELTQGQSGGR